MSKNEQNKKNFRENVTKSVGVASVSMTGAAVGLATGSIQLEDADRAADTMLDQTGNATAMATEVNDFEEIVDTEQIPSDIEEVIIHPSEAQIDNEAFKLEELRAPKTRRTHVSEGEEDEEEREEDAIEDAGEDEELIDDDSDNRIDGTVHYADNHVVSGEFIDPSDIETENDSIVDFGRVYTLEDSGATAADVYYDDGTHMVFVDNDGDGIFDTQVFPDGSSPYDISECGFNVSDAEFNNNDDFSYMDSSGCADDDVAANVDIVDSSMV